MTLMAFSLTNVAAGVLGTIIGRIWLNYMLGRSIARPRRITSIVYTRFLIDVLLLIVMFCTAVYAMHAILGRPFIDMVMFQLIIGAGAAGTVIGFSTGVTHNKPYQPPRNIYEEGNDHNDRD